jgi:hypothetical protein
LFADNQIQGVLPASVRRPAGARGSLGGGALRTAGRGGHSPGRSGPGRRLHRGDESSVRRGPAPPAGRRAARGRKPAAARGRKPAVARGRKPAVARGRRKTIAGPAASSRPVRRSAGRAARGSAGGRRPASSCLFSTGIGGDVRLPQASETGVGSDGAACRRSRV